ncbi:MAG TPA: hypothetical protein VGF95_02230 [Solirubrobacteraceae bacterium]
MRSIKLSVLGGLATSLSMVVAALAPAGAVAAPAAQPAWQVYPVVGPTNLYETTGQLNEVQRVDVGSSFKLSLEGQKTDEMSCGTSAPEMQSELEALSTVGSGNVSVVETREACAYAVTFEKALGYRELAAMESSSTQTRVEIVTPGRGGWGELAIYPVNEGGAPTSGPITVTVALPSGITTYETPAFTEANARQAPGGHGWSCQQGSGLTVVTCTSDLTAYPGYGPGAESESLRSDTSPALIPLSVESATPGVVEAEITLSGGGAAPVTVQAPITISQKPVTPGLAVMKSRAYEADGSAASQAGAHPFAITTGFFVRTTLNAQGEIVPTDEMKNVETQLPPGFIGNPQSVPQCDSHGSVLLCDAHDLESQVGVTSTVLFGFGEFAQPFGLFNLVPEARVPAEFGFHVVIPDVHLRASVRSDGDYGITVSAPNTVQILPIYGSIVTFWGRPNEAAHDEERCEDPNGLEACQATKVANTPFLVDPSDCVAQAQAQPDVTMELSFWQSPDMFSEPLASGLVPVSGCNRVPFQPSLHLTLTQHTSASPTGLLTELQMPQLDSSEGIAEADVEKAVVTLPEGMTLSPASAGGLGACSESEIGLVGKAPTRFDEVAPSCPESSKLGTFTVDTPYLPNPLNGNIYLAEQDKNPFGTLLAVYLYAYDPVSGVEIKVAGRVDADPVTGRITATFENLPQLAFGDVKLNFKSGPRAPIMTPSSCGTFAATSDLTPTSKAGIGPEGEAIAGDPDALSTDDITIEGCKPTTFGPSFVSGGANAQAGAYTPFTMTLSRNSDEEAAPRTISMTMPAGLSGMLSNVALCGEPQAGQGTCSQASQIGHVTVTFGDGPNPLTLPEAGKGQDPVYLTGPYKGAPFGLAIVVPAEAGPFNLGTVVVRAKVLVNPLTAQISVVSDPMPTILEGIPTDLRTVNVQIDREQFTFNPTSCEPTSVTAQIGSSNGENAAVASRFQVANCGTLHFKPQLKASTAGKTSRADGASLDVKLSYPKAPFGSQANIAKVKVELPKQLPSRLSTLQKACPDSTFDANPAACPAASQVGSATATTPILPVPLTGPAYFVSHGGAKFPELIVVLQGYGVTVQLHGETFISKAGITSSTFNSVPDVPVSTFELRLPQGKDSALAANEDLCSTGRTVSVRKKVRARSKRGGQTVTRRVRKAIPGLAMPTVFTAQNGAVIHQSTPIEVTGCGRHKTTKEKRRKKKTK